MVFETFEEFWAFSERRIRYALTARYGFEIGTEATAEALGHAWRNWTRIGLMENPVGYTYRVAERFGRRMHRRRTRVFGTRERLVDEVWVEPGLENALGRLSPRQRAVVVLVHGLEFTHREVAETIGISPSSVQTHLERGLRTLRSQLGVDSG